MEFLKQKAHHYRTVSKFLVFIHVTFYALEADGSQIIKVGQVYKLSTSSFLGSSPDRAYDLRFNIWGNSFPPLWLHPSLLSPGLYLTLEPHISGLKL